MFCYEQSSIRDVLPVHSMNMLIRQRLFALLMLTFLALGTQALHPAKAAFAPAFVAHSEPVASMEARPAPGVGFTLANRSLKSIPLQIPGVMNPNLSPMSNSGVSLAVGQEIFFFEGRKKYLLLVVGPEYAGQTLVVNELIKAG
jgi:hypothetical protein